MAPKTFPQFRQLPVELRIKVWKYTAIPRIIKAKNENRQDEKHYDNIYKLQAGPVPPILHINHESRTVGLRIYTLVASELSYVTSRAQKYYPLSSYNTKTIYMDLRRDTLFIVTLESPTALIAWLRAMGREDIGGLGGGDLCVECGVKGEGRKVKRFGLKRKRGDSSGSGSESAVGGGESSSSSGAGDKIFPAWTSTSTTISKTAKPPHRFLANIALPLSSLLQLCRRGRIDYLLTIAMLYPHLQTLTIVTNPLIYFDPAYPQKSASPLKYTLRDMKPLQQGSQGRKLGTASKDSVNGGAPGYYRHELVDIFGSYFVDARERSLKKTVSTPPNSDMYRLSPYAFLVAGSRGTATEMQKIRSDFEKWVSEEKRVGWTGPNVKLGEIARW